MIQKGKDMVTLLSCHPYVLGGGPYRYVVFCERVDTQERKETDGVMNPKSSNPSSTSEEIGNTDSAEKNTASASNSVNHTNQTESSPAIVQNQEGLDLLALEQTLRYMLPIIVIMISALIVLLRKPKSKHSKKQKSRRHKRNINKQSKNKNKRRKSI